MLASVGLACLATGAHAGVIRWLTEELTCSGQERTERRYASYLYSAGDAPV